MEELTYLLGDCRNKVEAYCITARHIHYYFSNVVFECRSCFVHKMYLVIFNPCNLIKTPLVLDSSFLEIASMFGLGRGERDCGKMPLSAVVVLV